jgi:hypothetical protein
MRKRLVIGAIAVVVIGVAAYVFSQPKEGTVEWHKREYASVVRKLERRTLADRASVAWGKIRGNPFAPLVPRNDRLLRTELERHRVALLTSGYFVERRFTTTNRDARVLELMMKRKWEAAMLRERKHYTWLIGARGSDTLVVFGQPEDMGFWEKAIREAEQMESGK